MSLWQAVLDSVSTSLGIVLMLLISANLFLKIIAYENSPMLMYLFCRETCIVTFLLGGINCVRSTRSMPTGEVSSIFFVDSVFFLVPESLIKSLYSWL